MTWAPSVPEWPSVGGSVIHIYVGSDHDASMVLEKRPRIALAPPPTIVIMPDGETICPAKLDQSLGSETSLKVLNKDSMTSEEELNGNEEAERYFPRDEHPPDAVEAWVELELAELGAAVRRTLTGRHQEAYPTQVPIYIMELSGSNNTLARAYASQDDDAVEKKS